MIPNQHSVLKLENVLDEQITLLKQHHNRLMETSYRYVDGTVERALANLRLAIVRDQIELLEAIREGKTVQPS